MPNWSPYIKNVIYDKLYDSQNGVCAICCEPPSKGKNLFIDHDHISGHIRGLLCSSCNPGLGFFKDNERLLARAIVYLQDSSIPHPDRPHFSFSPLDSNSGPDPTSIRLPKKKRNKKEEEFYHFFGMIEKNGDWVDMDSGYIRILAGILTSEARRARRRAARAKMTSEGSNAS